MFWFVFSPHSVAHIAINNDSDVLALVESDDFGDDNNEESHEEDNYGFHFSREFSEEFH